MTASLARFLPDFELSRINAFQATRHDDRSSNPSCEPEFDIEAIRAEARAEGEAMARAELALRHDSERQADASRHAAELEALRAELEVHAAQIIPAAIAARSDEIAGQISADVEAVLAPLIDEAVRARIIAALAAEIRDILELENAGRVSVSGPKSLMTALREAIGPAADKLVIRENGGFDIEVEVDRTRFATRISAWASALAESLS
ncbi:MAG: hypothetical protein KUA43_08325 [Hoeflea sp.]|uniref:hypothetical protein n=1 Tax=Hoeflea sp. TaxID=1940281 RepID=UPI001DF3A3D4|nr:hypothetical protein [Hoeflea sp.]MBU4528967.1 hypothetical protein [Alphaproteobacteria bacterium]MBU4544100.1 hypothetical protein [Alphaproteobacteria bacterium]MBU4551969.1 hypothetical protein [Alphaproteobacteria bacterium]MBV1723434.1 hypothetical protein [Hoeflea sp.]MBV1760413.1 hypothetical protein [Hoeflea sp.]